MNIEYIRSFLETARVKSISKASAKLHLTHQALSKQLRSVEAYFGVSLFHRSNSGVELTEAGQQLLDRILPVYTEFNSIRSELLQKREQLPLSMTFGTLPTLASYYMPDKVIAMESSGIQVQLKVAPTSIELYEQLQAGILDAIVCECLPYSSLPIWKRTLFAEPYAAIVYKEHPLASQSTVSAAQLSEEPLIVHPPECRIRQALSSQLERLGCKPSIKMEVGFHDFILGYVAAGAGITLIPRMAADHLNHVSLTAIPISDEGFERVISVITLQSGKGKGRLLSTFLLGSDASNPIILSFVLPVSM